ncbi:hypothetical protein PT974_12189 [Cladobotryum mycophilum]|uniref:Uncharacterized protein n=1 Tax=Cladobotryum mycophilum TaxID=491253 RepID=A0ABR0S7A8_9HYPO
MSNHADNDNLNAAASHSQGTPMQKTEYHNHPSSSKNRAPSHVAKAVYHAPGGKSMSERMEYGDSSTLVPLVESIRDRVLGLEDEIGKVKRMTGDTRNEVALLKVQIQTLQTSMGNFETTVSAMLKHPLQQLHSLFSLFGVIVNSPNAEDRVASLRELFDEGRSNGQPHSQTKTQNCFEDGQ